MLWANEQGLFKVCHMSPCLSCAHWIGSVGSLQFSARNLLSCKGSRPDQFAQGDPRCPHVARGSYSGFVSAVGCAGDPQSLPESAGSGAFAIRHHGVLTEVLGLELCRPPSDSPFRYFFKQVDVAVLCAAIRDWIISQIPGGASYLYQLVCGGKTLRGSIQSTAGGGSAFIAQFTLYSSPWVRRSLRPTTSPARSTYGQCSERSSVS